MNKQAIVPVVTLQVREAATGEGGRGEGVSHRACRTRAIESALLEDLSLDTRGHG